MSFTKTIISLNRTGQTSGKPNQGRMADRVCVNVGHSVFDFRTLVSILCTQLNRTASAGIFALF